MFLHRFCIVLHIHPCSPVCVCVCVCVCAVIRVCVYRGDLLLTDVHGSSGSWCPFECSV